MQLFCCAPLARAFSGHCFGKVFFHALFCRSFLGVPFGNGFSRAPYCTGCFRCAFSWGFSFFFRTLSLGFFPLRSLEEFILKFFRFGLFPLFSALCHLVIFHGLTHKGFSLQLFHWWFSLHSMTMALEIFHRCFFHVPFRKDFFNSLFGKRVFLALFHKCFACMLSQAVIHALCRMGFPRVIFYTTFSPWAFRRVFSVFTLAEAFFARSLQGASSVRTSAGVFLGHIPQRFFSALLRCFVLRALFHTGFNSELSCQGFFRALIPRRMTISFFTKVLSVRFFFGVWRAAFHLGLLPCVL